MNQRKLVVETSKHRREFVGENRLEDTDAPHTKKYWVSHKKPYLDLLEDGQNPFNLERQMEDQRYQMIRNRNPQLDVPTKAEKSRSQLVIMKKGATRTIAMKARVLNKIVREESGVHNYTLVPPLPTDGDDAEKEPIDPETHPLFRPYALEAHQKPVIMDFGHRPSSASRTFNPATMKIRMRHGAVAKQEKPPGTTGFGIPVSVLTKVLHAGELLRPSEAAAAAAAAASSTSSSAPSSRGRSQRMDGPMNDPMGLFPSDDVMEELGILKGQNPGKKSLTKSKSANWADGYGTTEYGTTEDSSSNGRLSVTAGPGCRQELGHDEDWGAAAAAAASSSAARTAALSEAATGSGGEELSPFGKSSRRRKKVDVDSPPDANYPAPPDVRHRQQKEPKDNRPAWNETFQNLYSHANEKILARKSAFDSKSSIPLKERLRFAKLAVADYQFVPFCTEKQETDKYERETGRPFPVKPPEPLFGYDTTFEDPFKYRITYLKKERENSLKKKDDDFRRKMFTVAAHEVPDVAYNPFTALQLMRSEQAGVIFKKAADSGSPTAYTTEDLSRKHLVEREFVLALNAARNGDKRAMVNYYLSFGGDGAGGSPFTDTGGTYADVDGGARPGEVFDGEGDENRGGEGDIGSGDNDGQEC